MKRRVNEFEASMGPEIAELRYSAILLIDRRGRLQPADGPRLTGGPRLAVMPAHAILNYCFALLQAETRLALSALGLDSGLGIGLHTDTADSLALDVLEPVRPQVEA